MNDREQIFQSIKSALEPLPGRTAYPDWNAELPVSGMAPNGDPIATLRERVVANKAIFVEGWEALLACLKDQGVTHGYLDPALFESVGNFLESLTFETHIARNRIDEYQFGITPASGAIAETGTVILRDSDGPHRLGALAPWVHVAVVNRDHVFATVSDAVNAMGNDPSIVWVTGPSKTADIEGILIQGVHGPGVQVCCLV